MSNKTVTQLNETGTEQQGKWADLLSGTNALLTIALTGGVALHAINIYIVTTILPSVVNDIGGLEYYAWNTTLFVATSIIGSALSSKVLDSLGPKWAYLFALALFSFGSIWCALSPSMLTLLGGRALQGLGGGMLFALSYALIRIVFTPNLWSRAMGVISGMWGIATLCGPAIGGIFAQGGHWRWAFWALLPVAVLLAIIVINQLPRKKNQQPQSNKIPVLAISLLVISVLAISIGSLSESLLSNLVGLLIGIALLITIAFIDGKNGKRLLPTGAYSLKTQLGMIFLTMCLLVGGMTTEIYVPYFLQTIHQFSPLMAGYLTAVMAAGWTVGALLSANKTGAIVLRILKMGPVIIFLSLVILAILTPNLALVDSMLLFALYLLAMMGVGLGIGVCWPHLVLRVFKAAPKGEENLASSSVITIQLYATALSAALVGVVVNNSGLISPGGLVGAQQASVWLFALFAISPFLAAILIRKVK
ncbi:MULTISPECIES: MFS transporter [Providencia]|uniref:MFS transporter n=2 Tax=Providencia alcalifaciens TaxID=126385 RepID=A0AAW9V9U4_9GAMM|nr:MULTISPECIES: MFS transporter [Providencia]EKT63197.1 major facilitator transporter [Providencia alcalifaciens Dmel2]MTC29844.1 MFS transporter [Providencia alcalifaciens]MTC34552.1 MFS transporter [Providencia alcalifaciens]